MKIWLDQTSKKAPPTLRNPGYAPDPHKGLVNGAKASPHAKFYNLSSG